MDSCPIWGEEAEELSSGSADSQIFYSPRADGKYVITREAKSHLSRVYKGNHRFKARLTTWLVNQRALGEEFPKVTFTTLEDTNDQTDLSVQYRADQLLKALSDCSLYLGLELWTSDECLGWKLMAHSECINHTELNLLIDYLSSQSWLKGVGSQKYVITVQGYGRLAELRSRNPLSSQAFIAMWFDETMNEAYVKGIRPGVEDAGFTPMRIDNKEHSNKIDDEIIAEIRRSRFVVADFTQGDEGTRGGVYYEAGFAKGLGIPVIFCCRKDSIKKVHFDTRQYNHIVWNQPSDLRDSLAKRISADIGDGPSRKQ